MSESSTTILRRLLDECGVEYFKHEDGEPLRKLEKADEPATSWHMGGASVCAVPIEGSDLLDLWIDHCTPEQAIATTLGNEQNPDGLPVGLTISNDGTLLNWRGENYVRQSIVRDVKRKPNGDVDRCETCSDDRFELIAKAKQKLLDATNIDSRPDEIAVLDNILFRCWQMGWLDQLRDADTRWHELFGTPERAARTIADISERVNLDGIGGDYAALVEWLRGDA